MIHTEFCYKQVNPSGWQPSGRCGWEVISILNLSLHTGEVLPHIVTCWLSPVWAFVPVARPPEVLACALVPRSPEVQSSQGSSQERPLPSAVLAKRSLFITCDHRTGCLTEPMRPCGFCVFLMWALNFLAVASLFSPQVVLEGEEFPNLFCKYWTFFLKKED